MQELVSSRDHLRASLRQLLFEVGLQSRGLGVDVIQILLQRRVLFGIGVLPARRIALNDRRFLRRNLLRHHALILWRQRIGGEILGQRSALSNQGLRRVGFLRRDRLRTRCRSGFLLIKLIERLFLLVAAIE